MSVKWLLFSYTQTLLVTKFRNKVLKYEYVTAWFQGMNVVSGKGFARNTARVPRF